jgi:AraC family cel operon transcriptional repressor
MRIACAHFKLAAFVRPGESYHFAQTELTADNAARSHDHDYHEVFWVTHGRGDHLLNGQATPLLAGQLHLIRPQDRHRVTGSDAAPLRIANLAFPSRAWAEVCRRYFCGERDWFVRRTGRRMWLPDAKAQAGLAHWAERLATPERPRIALDGFLMELPLFLRQPPAGVELMPEWLELACREIVHPEHFSGGTPELARLAGRSPSHVARATVRWLKQTPTEIVNTARLDYSARQLAETGRPIMEIALDCGLNNLSHFYALFRKRFGVSPRKYRLQAMPTVRA